MFETAIVPVIIMAIQEVLNVNANNVKVSNPNAGADINNEVFKFKRKQ